MGELSRVPVSYEELPFDESWVDRAALQKRGVRDARFLDYARLKHTKRYKPSRIGTLEDFGREMRLILGEKVGIFSDYLERRFFSFGSCFATEIAAYLSALGADSRTTTLTEDVNSPVNNLRMLRRVFELNEDAIADGIHNASDIIVTLGNVFYLMDGNHIVLDHSKTAELREQSLGDVIEDIHEILSLLRLHSEARIFVTVSPVPISGYRGERYASAMEADCASKCRLRAALAEVNPQWFTYLPLFEVFKWLPPHQAFPTFGTDDGSARHISREQIRLVMESLTT